MIETKPTFADGRPRCQWIVYGGRFTSHQCEYTGKFEYKGKMFCAIHDQGKKEREREYGYAIRAVSRPVDEAGYRRQNGQEAFRRAATDYVEALLTGAATPGELPFDLVHQRALIDDAEFDRKVAQAKLAAWVAEHPAP